MNAVGPRRILAALDDSARKAAVFDAAVWVARRTGATVQLIRVHLVPPEIPPGAHATPDGLEGWLARTTEAEFHELMAKVPDVSFDAPLVVFDGPPWRRILEAAKVVDADLIVVGNHKHHGLDRVFESVAGKIIDHTHRDVLVVSVRELPRSGAEGSAH